MRQKNILPLLFITLLLDVIGIGMLIPIIPSLFTDSTSPSFMLVGYSTTAQYIIAGLVTSLFGVMQFLVAPLLGDLSDEYGRKKLLALGVGVLALSQILFATGVAIGSLVLLLCSRIVAGIAGANFSIAQATIADVTTPENRARNFGLIGAAFGLGFILGPLISGWIIGITHNPSLPFLFAGVLGICNLLFVTLMLPETHLVRTKSAGFSIFKAFYNIKKAYLDKDAKPLYLASFFLMMGFAFFTSFISIFLVVRFAFTETATGTFFAVIGGWMVFTQIFVVRIISKKYSERVILLTALPVLAGVILIHPFIYSVILVYAIVPLTAMSFGLLNTTLPALISKGVGKDRQGSALGINGSLQALSQGVAPLLAGSLAGVFGINAVFIIGAGFVMSAWLVVRGK